MPVRAASSGDPQTWALLADVHAHGPQERVDIVKAGAGWRLERIVSHGHTTPSEPGTWYDQDEDEWVMVISGRGRLAFADRDDEVELGPGDAIWLPAHQRHRVAWTHPDEPTVWLALFVDRDAAVRTSRRHVAFDLGSVEA